MGRKIFFPVPLESAVPPELNSQLVEYRPPSLIAIFGCRLKESFQVPSKLSVECVSGLIPFTAP